MIFVTVGTHEQPFNRLIKFVDTLKADNVIKENIIIQTGFSTYEPKACHWSKLFTYEEMQKNVENARIVITHGGPASFFMPLQMGKIPIVVPRQVGFGEHVNNHQVDFAKMLSRRRGTILPVYAIETLEEVILTYDTLIERIAADMKSNNTVFCNKLEELVEEIIEM
ncbi:multidrug MFS transporter [Anaerocolumna cellulosilytica]|uniref:Multidrug MFS transporter n=1 Tax=Anaerocolumna cellulosilytica TaxID=433286 RepID=A0A6S6RD55_9FIRM|nr:glycosyltransferase [Anaerocolumna cellulosilytica]MBB5195265.1 UDP-N-acetylglucosamine transferase subunit ALG13 [Anaerocolumna cellulosilytica]BCJ96738.1 multidrug MFS transporter [Anaerocolumna cellulosilytica]